MDTCLINPAILDKLQQNLKQSKVDGINEVPITIINGVRIVGAKPLEEFITVIEEQHAGKE